MKNHVLCVCVGILPLVFSAAACEKEGLAVPGTGGTHAGGAPGSGGGSNGDALPPSGGGGTTVGAGGTSGTLGGGTGGHIDLGGANGGGTTGLGGTAAGGAGGSGGSSGKTCGGFAGIACPTGQLCELPPGMCGASDASGTCVAPTAVCPSLYAPVCGCDKKNYANDCIRRNAGVAKSSDGECPTATAACPADISQISTWPCTEGLICEYGVDPRSSCRPSASCSGGKWAVTQVKCVPPPVATCPATRDAAAGKACTPDGAYCTYADIACLCSNCRTGGPVDYCGGDTLWQCPFPNATPGCPAGIPLLGSACSSEGLRCEYGCGTGRARVCKGKAWYSANGMMCPVSTRRAKKDIVYLSEAERRRVASDLLHFKLATYEYRDPALAGTRHLGFIIEDVTAAAPESPAVERDGTMVDLYGYASMLLAAVQAQGQEIAQLKAELARLKLKRR